MLRFRGAGRTHDGLVREHNEDAAFCGPYLQVVADGVGGAAAGEVASATAAYVTSALAARDRGRDLLAVLAEAVDTIQEQLELGVAGHPSRAGMGTTLTALITDGERCALGHVGDSRAYLLRDGGLVQLTRDHTFVQALVDDGVITREQARHHPRKNLVLNALEAGHPADPDLTLLELGPGDRLLVCSDGLTDMVDDEDVAAGLARQDAVDAAEALVAAALAAGGRDNVTCLVSDVVEGPELRPDGQLLGALGDPALVVDPARVHAGPTS